MPTRPTIARPLHAERILPPSLALGAIADKDTAAIGEEVSGLRAPGLRDSSANAGRTTLGDRVAVRDDYTLDREVGERFERGQELGVGLIDEDAGAGRSFRWHVAGGERGVLADEEDDLLRLAVELDRLDARRQFLGRRPVGDLAPDGARRVQTEVTKRSTKSAVPR